MKERIIPKKVRKAQMKSNVKKLIEFQNHSAKSNARKENKMHSDVEKTTEAEEVAEVAEYFDDKARLASEVRTKADRAATNEDILPFDSDAEHHDEARDE